MLKATIFVSLLAGVATLFSLLNQLLLANLFGVGSSMDAYVVGISVPLFINGLIGGGLSQLLVPLLQSSLTLEEEYNRRLVSLILSVFSIGVILAVAGLLCSEFIVHHFLPGLSSEQFKTGIHSAVAGWLAIPLSLVAGVYTAALHVRRLFLVATLLQSFPALGSICICAVLFKTLGAASSAWGQLLGYAMWVLIASSYNPIRRIHSIHWQNIRYLLRALPLTVLGGLIFGIYSISDAYWGGHVGPSAASYLGYGQRLIVALSGLAVIGTTTVIFPQLAQYAAEGNFTGLRRSLAACMRLILVFTAPASVLVCALAKPAIQLLLQRGSFDATATQGLASILPGLLIGMVPMSCMGVVFKAFYASKRIKAAALISILGGLFYTIASGVLSMIFGAPGITIAYAAAWWVILGFSLKLLWRQETISGLMRNLKTFGVRLVGNTAAVALISFGGKAYLSTASNSNQVAAFFISAGIAAVSVLVYLSLGRTNFATDELRTLTARIAWLRSIHLHRNTY